MVKSVRLKGYNPEEFKNPALTLFQNTLAAIALNRDAPEPLEDETLPQIEHLVKKTANAAKDLEENVEEVLESMNPGEVKSLAAAAAAKNRPLPDGDEEGPRKRGGGSDKPVTVDDIEIFAKADRVSAVNRLFRMISLTPSFSRSWKELQFPS
jgi:ATP-dependent DNA helicase 2 subunit 1